MKALHTLSAAAVLGAAAFFAPSASASDVRVSIGAGSPYYAPAYADDCEQVWVPPVYRTEYYGGYPRQIIVVPGYYRRVERPVVYGRSSWYPSFFGSWFGGRDRDRRDWRDDRRDHDRHDRDHDRRDHDGRDGRGRGGYR